MFFTKRTAAVITTFMLLTGVLLIWWTGGTGRAFAHLLYVPILFAAIELDVAGGLTAALAASIGVALMPINRERLEPQTFLTVGVHAVSYLTAAVSTGAVVHYLRVQQVRVQNGFVESVASLVNALEASDDCTAGHSIRVSEISVAMGEALGLRPAELETLRHGAMLHDLGKVGVPAQVLNKPGKLTWEELSLIRHHAAEGDQILSAFSHVWIREIRDMVRHHHERLDGSGYPDGLKGSAISPLVRIVMVADVYDAVTSLRPYRSPMSEAEAFAMLEEEVSMGRLDGPAVAALRQLVQSGRLVRRFDQTAV